MAARGESCRPILRYAVSRCYQERIESRLHSYIRSNLALRRYRYDQHSCVVVALSRVPLERDAEVRTRLGIALL